MPKCYSTELVTLIKAMLNSNPDRRPSVNRILRDPYIKKNIALFLEGTRKKYDFHYNVGILVFKISFTKYCKVQKIPKDLCMKVSWI